MALDSSVESEFEMKLEWIREFVCTVGTMRRYVDSADQPVRKDLRGLGMQEGDR